MIRLIAFLLLIAPTAFAQSSDIKLSIDPIQRLMPLDAQIQTAATIGDTTLVVWGSTKFDGDGRHVLWMQMLVDTVAVGEKRIVSSDESRPYGFVQAVAIGKQFLLVWNDRRKDAPGAYACRIGCDGSVGVEERFGGAIASSGIDQLPVVGRFLLFWRDATSNPRTHWRSIDSGGSYDTTDRSISGRLQMIRTIDTDPRRLLVDFGSGGALIYELDGTEVPMTEAQHARFTRKYYLADDGKMVVVFPDSVRVYRSYLDDLPQRSIPTGYVSLDGVPWLDSSGHVTIDWGGSFTSYHSAATQNFILLHITFTHVDEPTLGKWRKREDTIPGVPGGTVTKDYEVSTGISTRSIERVGDNVYRGVYDYSYSYWHWFKPDVKTTRRDSLVFYYYNGRRNTSVPRLSSLAEHISPRVRVERLPHPTESTIRVDVNSTWVTLSAPAEPIPANVPDLSPGLRLIDGALFVAAYQYGVDSVASLVRWNRSAGRSEWIDSISVRSTSSIPPDRMNVKESKVIGVVPGMVYMAVTAAYDQRVDPWTVRHVQQCDVFIPTSSGWRRSFTQGGGSSTARLALVQAATDRAADKCLFALGEVQRDSAHVWYSKFCLNGVDREARVEWRVDTLRMPPQPPGFGLMPIAKSEFLVATQHSLFRCVGESVREVARGTPPAYNFHYRMFSDDRILCWYWREGRVIDFFMLDTNGVAVDSLIGFVPPVGMADPFLALSSSGGSAVMLMAGVSGVRALRFDRSLRSIDTIAIGSTSARRPVGLFVGDTLWVAWEDYRRGIPDVHGTFVSLRQLNVGVEDAGTIDVTDRITIAPVPARDHIVVTLPPSIRGEVVIEIVDDTGTRHMSLTTSDHETAVDVSAVPSGSYTLRVIDGAHARTARLIITH